MIEREKLSDLIFEAMGEVSMCWSDVPKGRFEDVRAVAVVERLIQEILLLERNGVVHE